MSLKFKMILDKVKITIKKYKLIAKGDRILIGVSGGPDSVALLYLLKALTKELKLKLHIAHLDHKLRKESRKDREFVEKLALKLKIPLTTSEVDIKRLAKSRGSVEEIARNARLEFFFKTAKKIKTKKIALGHNLDDQAETVLMRLIRGAGLYGLSGILPKKEMKGFTIIRPLIETRRKDIEAYLNKKRIKARIDESNLKDIYFRNRVRHDLLPLLEKKYNKNIKELLSNTAETIAYDYDFLNEKAESLVRGLKNKIELTKAQKMHPAMRRLVLRLMIARLKRNTRRLTFQHIQEIEDLIFNRPKNSIVDLPQGVSVAKNKKHLCFYRR